MSAEDLRLANVMAQVAMTLGAASDLDETLVTITKSACDTIPGADFASISARFGDGHLETLAPTDEIILQVDQLQYELLEGPCYQAATEERTVVADDLASDPRWPRYGPAVVRMGVRSQLALELYESDESTGALNLYSSEPGGLSGQRDLAELFATHAAIAMGHVRTVGGLVKALATRKIIGAAVGITMERYQIDEDQAFKFLVRVSQTGNIKLRDVAAQLVSRAKDDGAAD